MAWTVALLKPRFRNQHLAPALCVSAALFLSKPILSLLAQCAYYVRRVFIAKLCWSVMGPCEFIEDAVQSAQLERQIIFVGWGTGDRVKTEILNARALILPSFSENMPVVIMEAMALGRPVISTYVAGIPELIQPGQTGWLVPASDEGELAEAIHQCLIAPATELERMGQQARRHVAEHHDSTKEAAKILSLFERSINRTRG